MPTKYLVGLFTVLTIILGGLFFGYGLTSMDPDFGWHLRTGQIILESGIPQTDPFTYSMPSYHYIDHEWLSDVIIAQLYRLGDYQAANIFFTVLMLLSIAIILPRRNIAWSIFPILLVSPILLSYGGIRVQVISWVLVALVLKIGWSWENLSRWRWSLPIIFLGWASLHGSYPIGLFLLALIIIYYSWQKRQLHWINFGILGLSTLITLANPYGYQLWTESWWQTFNLTANGHLQNSIQEWVPLWVKFNPILGFYLIFSALLFIRYWREIPTLHKILYLLLLLASFSARRHLPFWLLISIPIFTQNLISIFHTKFFSQLPSQIYRRTVFMFLIVCLSLFAFYSKYTFNQALDSTEIFHYPYGAVVFMKIYPIKQNLFAPYAWGGYLVWKIPTQKVFIDGRMPTWMFDAPDGQSDFAYQEYLDFTEGKTDTAQFLAKYNIRSILWPRSTEKTNPMMKNLEQLGWRRIYNDPVSAIYQSPLPSK